MLRRLPGRLIWSALAGRDELLWSAYSRSTGTIAVGTSRGRGRESSRNYGFGHECSYRQIVVDGGPVPDIRSAWPSRCTVQVPEYVVELCGYCRRSRDWPSPGAAGGGGRGRAFGPHESHSDQTV